MTKLVLVIRQPLDDIEMQDWAESVCGTRDIDRLSDYDLYQICEVLGQEHLILELVEYENATIERAIDGRKS
jgi:hypothetical protein